MAPARLKVALPSVCKGTPYFCSDEVECHKMRSVISLLASGLSLTPPLFQLLLPRHKHPAPLQSSFSVCLRWPLALWHFWGTGWQGYAGWVLLEQADVFKML